MTLGTKTKVISIGFIFLLFMCFFELIAAYFTSQIPESKCQIQIYVLKSKWLFSSHYCPIFINTFCSGVIIRIADPNLFQEICTIHNHKTDKNRVVQELFASLLGNGILLSKNDSAWKNKRKVSAHAFYKKKLNDMLENFKQLIGK